MWSLTLRILLRFMLCDNLKPCSRVIDSNANISNLKNKVKFFLGCMNMCSKNFNTDSCLGSRSMRFYMSFANCGFGLL